MVNFYQKNHNKPWNASAKTGKHYWERLINKRTGKHSRFFLWEVSKLLTCQLSLISRNSMQSKQTSKWLCFQLYNLFYLFYFVLFLSSSLGNIQFSSPVYLKGFFKNSKSMLKFIWNPKEIEHPKQSRKRSTKWEDSHYQTYSKAILIKSIWYRQYSMQINEIEERVLKQYKHSHWFLTKVIRWSDEERKSQP